MPLVNPEILFRQQSPDLQGAFQQGLQTRGLLRQDNAQQQKAARMRAFEQAFTQASQGQDLTNPENMGNALKQTFQMFPEETMETAKRYQEAFPQAKAKDYQIEKDETGTFRPIDKTTGLGPDGKPVKAWQEPAKPSAPKKYEMVKNRKGIFEAIDPETGLNKQGKPVEAWIDPKAPAGPKPPDMRGVFEMEQKLAKDFATKAEKSIGVATAFNKIEASIKQNNPLDAYNAIVQFVKIIDPGTAAREGEVSSAVLASAGGAGNRLIQAARNAYNGTLDPTTAGNIIASAKALMGAEKKTFDALRAETKHKIKSYNARGYQLDEGAILGDYDTLFSGGGAPKKQITEADLDKMTDEELKAFVGGQ